MAHDRSLPRGAVIVIAAMALAACGKTKPSTQMTGAAGQVTAGTTGSAGTTGAAGTTGTTAVTCDDYCTVMKAACKGPNAQYYDQADCMKVCAHLPLGTPTDTTGNTVGCRTNVANAAVFETTAIKPSCWAAGPLGFGVCGSECDVFCAIAMSYCSAAEGYTGAPLFASLDECHDDCGAWNRQRDFSMPGAYVATYSPGPTPETADTLECRAYHLLVNAFKTTAAQQVHCPHAANKSEICGSGYVAPPVSCPPPPDGGTQCANGLDDDGDGLIDALDPDCTTPYDVNEELFQGVPGDVEVCRPDCQFDSNSGQGDDQCDWSLRCDPMAPVPSCGPVSSTGCSPAVTQHCRDFCLPKTPNGCDCFGCCAVDVAGARRTVLISEGILCSSQTLSDPTRCPSCTQNTDCLNPCLPGEVCFAGAAPITGPTTELAPRCPQGQVACGAGAMLPCLCPAGTYCVTGCCVPFSPQP